MTLFAISGLSVFISCIFISIITLYFGKTKPHRLLLLFNVVVAVWGLGLFLVGTAKDRSLAISGWKIAYCGGFLVGPVFYHLVCTICNIKREKILFFAYLQAFVFIFLNSSTNLVVTDARFVFDIYYNKLNLIFLISFLFYSCLVVLSFYELIRFQPTTSGSKRIQINHIILGFSIGFLGATSAFLPLFQIDIIYPFGNFGITIYVFLITYAILRYHLMEIHLVFKKTVVYSLSVGLLTGLFIILVLFLSRYLSALTGADSFTITVISALVIAVLFNPFKNIIQSFVDKVFFKTTYDYLTIIKNTSHELASTIDLKYIYAYIANIVFDTLKIKNVYLISVENCNYKTEYSKIFKDKYIDVNNKYNPGLDQKPEMAKLLENKKIILKNEILEQTIYNDESPLANELKTFADEALVPIFIDNNLTYILILGEKLSGDIFSFDDLNLLQTLANQASISLKNARLYENLEILVEKRTEELSETNRLLRNEITNRKGAEERLMHQAYYDPITNLTNRVFFLERLKFALEYKKRYGNHDFAVFFMDLDRFKIVNDSLGHQAGDKLLIMISERLKKILRKTDTVARFGGDEFAILLGKAGNKNNIENVANKIKQLFKIPFNIDNKEIFSTFSIGIVTSFADNYSNPDEFMRDADVALYIAKERGRACHVIFEQKMHTNAVTLLTKERELRDALKKSEFILNYQPLILITDNKIAGFEALIRWEHPVQGLLLPSEFLSIAEETDLIVEIDKWVLKESLSQMVLWQKQFPKAKNLNISVNISKKMLFKPDFVDFVGQTIRKTGFNTKRLRLELNEKMIINNLTEISSIIEQLKSMSINLDIDNFGIEKSTLNYLRNLPVNGLKIDGYLINTLTSDKFNEEIVKTIINFAHTLKLDIIAEGVETEQQLKAFKNMNGKYAQGYLINKPKDKIEIEKLISG